MKFISLFIFLFSTTALAVVAPPSSSIVPRVTLAVSIYKPFIIQDSDGKLSGIYQEYITDLVHKAGMEPSFEIMPLPRMLHHATKGTYDLFMSVSGVPEAEGKYLEIARFHHLQVVLIGVAKKIDFSNGPLMVGKTPNSFCPVFSPEEEKKVKFFEYDSTDQALKMLLSKRLSAICTTREMFYYDLHQSQYANLKFKEFPDYHHDLVISLFANKRLPPEKIKSLSKAAVESDQKKVLSNIYKKYGLIDGARD